MLGVVQQSQQVFLLRLHLLSKQEDHKDLSSFIACPGLFPSTDFFQSISSLSNCVPMWSAFHAEKGAINRTTNSTINTRRGFYDSQFPNLTLGSHIPDCKSMHTMLCHLCTIICLFFFLNVTMQRLSFDETCCFDTSVRILQLGGGERGLGETCLAFPWLQIRRLLESREQQMLENWFWRPCTLWPRQMATAMLKHKCVCVCVCHTQ